MKKTICDLCGQEVREDDVRYINFYRYKEDKILPIHSELETCAICADKAHKKIIEEVKH